MLKNRVFVESSILITALLSSRGGSFYILTQLKNYLFLLLGLARIEILPNPSQISLKRLSKIINKEDAPILASAFSNSNYLLTLDKDFLNEGVRNFARENNVLIFTPKEFISFLRTK